MYGFQTEIEFPVFPEGSKRSQDDEEREEVTEVQSIPWWHPDVIKQMVKRFVRSGFRY